MAALVKELREQGERSNTYIFLYSDNGFHLGEHRLAPQKRTPYEHAIRVPLVVRGPGVPAGTTRGEFALNIDLAPTFADLAHTTAPSFVDGRSLTPLLRGGAPSTWRSAFLLELNRDNTSRAYGVRTARRKYIEYADGFRELYELKTDPYELVNSYDEEEMPPPWRRVCNPQGLRRCNVPRGRGWTVAKTPIRRKETASGRGFMTLVQDLGVSLV